MRQPEMRRKTAKLGKGWGLVWAHPRDVLTWLGSVALGRPPPHPGASVFSLVK